MKTSTSNKKMRNIQSKKINKKRKKLTKDIVIKNIISYHIRLIKELDKY